MKELDRFEVRNVDELVYAHTSYSSVLKTNDLRKEGFGPIGVGIVIYQDAMALVDKFFSYGREFPVTCVIARDGDTFKFIIGAE